MPKSVTRVKVPRQARLVHFFIGPFGKLVLVLVAVGLALGVSVFTFYYVKYSRLIERKFRSGPFATTSRIFAAPRTVAVGDRISIADIVSELRRSGYGQSRANRMGWYHVRPNAIEIFPGPDSYLGHEDCVLKFSGDKIVQILSLQDHTERPLYRLEPELITNLSDRNREKRRLVHFEDIPPALIQAVISIEDKRFFQHSGFDPLRIVKVAYVDLKKGRKEEGASTLSMQLARSFWLTQEKVWTRKIAEALITMELEQKLTKQQIFELYANQIPLGRRGSYSINGFGEAAQAYFGKDIRQLKLEEAAMLAGLIQRPSYYNPFRHPDRMRERRNVVLALMRQNGYIDDRQYAKAVESPLNLAPSAMESVEAPYFVDLVNEDLQNRFQDLDFQAHAYNVYTTLDLNLQHAAAEAVQIGMQSVDEQLKRRRRKGAPWPAAQCALIALNPHTGEIKALVGGRNYGVSQLNHVLAKRQPGSAFKPFVYAAAMNTAVTGGPRILTPVTHLLDQPTTFWFDGKPYEPANFKQEYHGEVTLRQALAKSMNVPTVEVAEMVGYDAVVDLAKRAGLSMNLQPTPAVALGAYEVTPIEIAGAYTVFANQGVYVRPYWTAELRGQNGAVLYTHKPETRPVLDPRVAYMMVDLLEEVLRSGTGAGVRARGFTVPAAGKTGTSHDGWFAGFTSELLCVVWVGFDDNEELPLEGAKSALPVWTEFMKRALAFREYRNTKPFEPPSGIISVEIDPDSGQLATPSCPHIRTEVFVAGTQPIDSCHLHGGNLVVTQVAGWETAPARPEGKSEPKQVAVTMPPQSASAPAAIQRPDAETHSQAENEPGKPKKKRGFFRRLWDVFK